MTYAELKAQFEGLLKRRDMTASQSDTFIQQAISRVQRLVRLPPQEKSVLITYDGVTFTDGEIPVPNDYLRLIALTATDGSGDEYEVKQKDLASVLNDRYLGGTEPRSFTRRGGVWVFGPTPAVDTQIRVDYYSEFSALSADSDSNFLTAGPTDLVIYGALSFAADYFIDRRAPVFEARFQSIVSEIQAQADQDALMSAEASAAYDYPEF